MILVSYPKIGGRWTTGGMPHVVGWYHAASVNVLTGAYIGEFPETEFISGRWFPRGGSR